MVRLRLLYHAAFVNEKIVFL